MQRVNICRDIMMERKKAAACYWSIVSAICATVNGDGNCTLPSTLEEPLLERLCEAARAIEHSYDPAELICAWQSPAPPLDYSKIKPKPIKKPAKKSVAQQQTERAQQEAADAKRQEMFRNSKSTVTMQCGDEPPLVINRVNLDPFAPLDGIELEPLGNGLPDIEGWDKIDTSSD